MSNAIAESIEKDFIENLKIEVAKRISEEKKSQFNPIVSRAEKSVRRLTDEIDVLGRRANLNLVIGSGISFLALAMLAYFIFGEKITPVNIDSLNFKREIVNQILLHFIPRFSLVIFVEVFSLFFLKLYKSSLGEIKYYQNELTSLESKHSALVTALNFGESQDVSNVIKEMMSIERNFKLQNGESTVDLEKLKTETNHLKDVLTSFASAIPKFSAQEK